MQYLLIVTGLVLVITAIQNTYAALGAQLNKDLFGSKGFLIWMLALIATGAIGYVSGWEKFSRYMLALILIAIILAQSKNSKTQGGLFGNALAQIKNPTRASAASNTPTASSPLPGPSTGSNPTPTTAADWWDISKNFFLPGRVFGIGPFAK